MTDVVAPLARTYYIIYMGLCFGFEVLLELLTGAAVVVGQVADDAALLQQGDAGGDVDGVLQVVGGDEDRGAGLSVVLGEHVLQDVLRRGVEEVEGLVEDDQLRTVEEGGDDAHLLLVTCGEVADELLVAEDLSGSEALELLQALVDGLLRHVGDLAQEGEIFLGGEEVDEEALVDVGTGRGFPRFGLGGVDAVEGDCALVGLEQVEEHAEEGGLTGSVVTYEAEDVAVVDGELGNVAGDGLPEGFFQILYGYHILWIFIP